MNFQENLGKLKVAINKELEHQFNIAISSARKKDDLVAYALEHSKKIVLSGGKRMRGALLYWAYLGLGGKEKKKIIKVAAAIELVHLFLLMHDDIMDRGNLRHGQKTLHRMFAEKKNKKIIFEEAVHYGNSMAIIIGDYIYALANKIITEADFNAKITVKVLQHLQSIIKTTVIGQSQDMEIVYSRNIDEKKILAMYENKTARYSIEGPLYLGAILAGYQSKKIFKTFSAYAIPIGVAFQIKDDILGIFGDEKKIGKSASSDIEEGKQSFLVTRAYKCSSSGQKKQLNSILGKKNITKKEVEIFKEILKTTGALEYSEKLALQYLKKGKEEIKKTAILPEAKNFLLDLAEYLENRNL
jgi:geranylgeranyl diphosphate synthase type I